MKPKLFILHHLGKTAGTFIGDKLYGILSHINENTDKKAHYENYWHLKCLDKNIERCVQDWKNLSDNDFVFIQIHYHNFGFKKLQYRIEELKEYYDVIIFTALREPRRQLESFFNYANNHCGNHITLESFLNEENLNLNAKQLLYGDTKDCPVVSQKEFNELIHIMDVCFKYVFNSSNTSEVHKMLEYETGLSLPWNVEHINTTNYTCRFSEEYFEKLLILNNFDVKLFDKYFGIK